MNTDLCQVANPDDPRLTCPSRESGGYQCEQQGDHAMHAIGEHTIRHALAGNFYACSAITTPNTCVTCDLPEDRWDALDPLYICGGSQCPDCNRHDLNEEATRNHAEVSA